MGTRRPGKGGLAMGEGTHPAWEAGGHPPGLCTDLWRAKKSMLPSLKLCFLVFSPVICFRVQCPWAALPRVGGKGSRHPRKKRFWIGSWKPLRHGGTGWCAHVFSVVRIHPRPHTQAARAQPQTPGCVARRNEVSFGESALDSHTKPGGLS